MREAPVVYDLCALLFVDETTTPIENPTVEWTTAEAVTSHSLLLQY